MLSPRELPPHLRRDRWLARNRTILSPTASGKLRLGGARAYKPPDLLGAFGLRAHGPQPRAQHPKQVGAALEGPDRRVGGATRAAPVERNVRVSHSSLPQGVYGDAFDTFHK